MIIICLDWAQDSLIFVALLCMYVIKILVPCSKLAHIDWRTGEGRS